MAFAAVVALGTAPRASAALAPWIDAEAEEYAGIEGERRIAPERARVVRYDARALEAILAGAPDEWVAPRGYEGVELSIPRVDGGELVLRIVDSPIMEPELAAKFPEIRTFRVVDAANPAINGRIDWTPHGFHAMVRTPEGLLFVDPYRPGDNVLHQAYLASDLRRGPGQAFECLTHAPAEAGDAFYAAAGVTEAMRAEASFGGVDLRTYRLAVAATVEYTAFHGGTVPLAMAAIVTAMNRVNGVYENDVAIRMILIANNDLVVYTAEPDPYTNNDGGMMLGQNQLNLDTVIGTANYDIGHVFSTGGGGVANLNGPCNAALKARGVTGLPSPTGDIFYIDYVAHEMGHQWGGFHTFNGNAGACSGGNRSAAAAYEPGSGSTIMAYAGICGTQDLQPNSDDYFHYKSLQQIADYSRILGGNACAAIIPVGSTPPVVNAGSDYTIPKSTPFALVGTATPEPAGATYCWEEYDLGPAGHPNSPTGNAPIFRSFDPVAVPYRTFPKLEDLLDNTPTIGEILPTYARTMVMRLTVRDNGTPAGVFGTDTASITVDGVSGPFLVTAPNTAITWSGAGPHTVTWDVAGTDLVPVSCSGVDVLLSLDGGVTFDRTLALNSPNDGTLALLVASPDSTTARVKVACTGNVFFDVSNVNFSISGSNLIFADGVESGDTALWSSAVP
jgi:hypothetical protein